MNKRILFTALMVICFSSFSYGITEIGSRIQVLMGKLHGEDEKFREVEGKIRHNMFCSGMGCQLCPGFGHREDQRREQFRQLKAESDAIDARRRALLDEIGPLRHRLQELEAEERLSRQLRDLEAARQVLLGLGEGDN